MATKLYDLAVKTGSYTDRDGNQKGRYQNVGAVLQNNEGGKFIMLAKWFNPAGVLDDRGGESVILSMFAPKEQESTPQTTPQQAQAAPQSTGQRQAAPQGKYDDIPF